MADYFDGLIGQGALKRKLSFYLDAFQKTSRLPFLLFCGAKGFGKTCFARAVAKHLKNKDGTPRPMYELNSSILQNNTRFFENIFLTLIHDRPVTILFDESHNIPKDLSQALLTICNSEKDPVRRFQWQDATYEFDFEKLTFMFATTEQDKLFPPLKDRLDLVDFQGYTHDDLEGLVKMYAEDVLFKDGIVESIAKATRGNARSCVKMAQDIETYCKSKEQITFGPDDWAELKADLGILPLGLTNSEVIVLRELNKRGACSLNMLAAATGLSRSALQRDIEQYLLKKDLVRIDGKRKITKDGQKILASIA